MTTIRLTADLAEFCEALRPGDVLLFEKLLRVSSAIQAGDLRPVSHAAVVVDIEAGLPRIVDATLRGAGRPAVDETSLAGLLGLRQRDARGEVDSVRAITARRPIGDGEAGPIGRQVAAQARTFVHQTRYSLLDLCTIAPYAFLRSSSRRFPGGFTQLLRGFTQVSRAFTAELASSGAPAVTCVELVYRALVRAGVPVAIDAPLIVDGRFRTNWRVGSPVGDEQTDPGGWGYPPVGVSMQPAGAPAEPGLAAALTELDDLSDRIARVKEPGPAGGNLDAQGVGGPPLEEADGVTPGDLLETPSLQTIAVLHRPLR